MGKKQCSKCEEWKTLDYFGKHKITKDGLRYWCKECENKNGKKYYENNKELISNRSKEYYEENLEKRKEYLNKNKIRFSKQQKEYKEINKEKVLKKKKEYNNSLVKFNSKLKIRKEIEIYEKEIKESKEGYLQCKCVYCGDWFTPTYQNINNRLIAINNENNGEGRLYCSEACKQACPTYGQHLYPKGFKEATSREVQPELRQMVLARDNYICQRCDRTKDELSEECIALHCHHLEGIHWEPLMSADMDMCITYCQPCHVKAHQQPDCGYHDQRCS